ncbi:hypothetical protein ACFFGR_15040 [Arthrobacter liuii]|uniref:Uncharacterized protein n=1 Tax=Arthrobacter liuii TaxID=1476996 RepID=A0ABQ2AXW6_9MICC|nr:hypothetical protein [Arthrobacter liuii]GGH99439.1 hypothetical protein GCM10007170_34280 [Arthrobacter liuii]
MKLARIIARAKEWIKADPGAWFHRTGIMALFGTALTANFVVEYINQRSVTPAAPMVILALVTALLLSLIIVVWDRAGEKFLIVLIFVTPVAAFLTAFQSRDLLAAPALPRPSLALMFSLAFTVVAAALTFILWGIYGGRVYNPEITPVQNGITLFGVLLSAIAFNLDPKLGPWIGWPIIAVTLFSLAPIWKGEAEIKSQIAGLERTIKRLEEEKAALAAKSMPTDGKGTFFGKRKGKRR